MFVIRARRPLLLVFALLGVGALGAILWIVQWNAEWPRPWATGHKTPFPVPDFSLRDQDNHLVKRTDLTGKVWIANFISTQCSQTCSLLSRRLVEVARQTSSDVQFLSFSVALEDGPAALKRFAGTIPGSADARWRLLAADGDSFGQLAAGMGIAVSAEAARRGDLLLWPAFFLVDRAGNVRGIYDGIGADVQRLVTDARALDAAPGAGQTQALWLAPDFSYQDQDGQALARQALRGRTWIADFIFTQCRSACPVLTARMRQIDRQLSDRNLMFVSFSVDPAHDTPAVLKAYAQTWHSDDPRWRLLSTTPDALRATAAAMHVSVATTHDAADPILHSNRFFLIDSDGQVRGAYDSTDEQSVAQLVAEARRLAPPREMADARSVDGPALYRALGCGGCHERAEVGPSLVGLAGRQVALADGSVVMADANYLRQSLVAPSAALVQGYGATMPSYAALDDAQITALVTYLQAMPAATAPVAARQTAIDPVCKMEISVGNNDLHVERGGQRYYFCSAACRDEFLRAPDRYAHK